jgi:hypothetical protein
LSSWSSRQNDELEIKVRTFRLSSRGNPERRERVAAASPWRGLLLIAVAITVTAGRSPATAQTVTASPRLIDGHVGIGGGASYQFDGTRSAYIGALTWTWNDDRFELGAIRFVTGQPEKTVSLANPNWTFQISRRWTFMRIPEAKFFFGLGGAYKTETDDLNGSHLNFAEQLGCRFSRSNIGPGFEIVVRHMSNAGFKKPNKGQDFITVIYVF